MKKLYLIVISIILILAIPTAAFAAVGEPMISHSRLPKDIYITPYADTQYTTVYSPWLKLIHIMTEAQRENGYIGGEAHQQVRSIAVSPFDENLVFQGTDTNGLWKTVNGGQHWYSVGSNDYRLNSIQDIFFHPTKPNVVYMASGTNTNISVNKQSKHDGVYRSKDKGETWEHILETTYQREFFDKLISADEIGNLYAVGGEGVYKSSDDGDTWEHIYVLDLENTNGMSRSISASADGKEIIAAFSGDNDESKGLHYSNDGGKTWTISAPEQGMAAYTTDIHPENQSWVVCFERKESQPTGIYQSLNKGKSWELVSELPTRATISMFGPKRANGTYRFYIQLAEATWPMRYTDDFGKTWLQTKYLNKEESLLPNNTGWYPQGFDVSKSNPEIMYTSLGGIHRSEDAGETAKWANSGNSGINVLGINFDSNGKMLLSCVDVGPVISNESFYETECPTFFETSAINGNSSFVNNVLVADPDNPEHLIGFNYTGWKEPDIVGRFFESYDGGRTASSIPSEKMAAPSFIEYDNDNHDIIYSSYYTSYDRGKTWEPNEHMIAAISPVDQNVFYGYRETGANTEVWISKDKGKTWEIMGKVGFSPKMLVAEALLLYPDVADVNTAYVVGEWQMAKIETGKGITSNFDGGFYEKFDGADMWAFRQNPKNPQHMLVSINSNHNNICPGVLETKDGGKTWRPVIGLVGHRTLYSIHFSPYDDTAFLCSMSGIMKYDYNAYQEFLDSKISIYYNDVETSFSKSSKIDGDTIMVPLRDAFELIGAEVNWDDATQSITISRGRDKIYVSSGGNNAVVNDEKINLGRKLYVQDGKTFMPLQLMSKMEGIYVGWDVETSKIVIKSN